MSPVPGTYNNTSTTTNPNQNLSSSTSSYKLPYSQHQYRPLHESAAGASSSSLSNKRLEEEETLLAKSQQNKTETEDFLLLETLDRCTRCGLNPQQYCSCTRAKTPIRKDSLEEDEPPPAPRSVDMNDFLYPNPNASYKSSSPPKSGSRRPLDSFNSMDDFNVPNEVFAHKEKGDANDDKGLNNNNNDSVSGDVDLEEPACSSIGKLLV
jgi:hypothetical protein